MDAPEWLMLAGLLIGIPAAIVSMLTGIGMLWRGYRQWRKALYDEAFERAAKESVLAESKRTIAQLEKEIGIKDAALADLHERERYYRIHEVPRLHRRIEELAAHVRRLAAALEALRPRKEAEP